MNSRQKILIVSLSSILALFLVLGGLLGRSASPDHPYRHFAVYTEVLSRIKSEYVEEPDIASVTLGAVNGLLEAVDPYASFLNADQYKQYLGAKGSRKADVGLVLSRKFGYVSIVNAKPDSPAAQAGLTTGDIVEGINGVSTRDMPLAYAELLLQGEPGSKVELSVMRVRRGTEPQQVQLVRAHTPEAEIESRVLESAIGYLRVDSLERGKAAQVGAHVRLLHQQGADRLILDVRRCAVGAPEEGLALADLFLDSGLMVYVQGQKHPRQEFQAAANDTISRAPLVVITGRGTAAGAEVAASALLDNKRAEIVGERTYGDAAIRRAVTLEDGSAIILSVAKYYAAGDKAIQDVGVTPTIPVTETEPTVEPGEEGEPLEAPPAPEAPKTPQEDPLLKKAIEVLTKGQRAAAALRSTTAGLTRPEIPAARTP